MRYLEMNRITAQTASTARSAHRRTNAAGRFVVGRVVLVALLVVSLSACGGGNNPDPDPLERERIEAVLASYLDGMAAAYASGDTSQLEGIAAPKEIAILQKKIGDLMAQENRYIEATLEDFVIEKILISNYSNAYVTTLETWDFRVLASGSDVVTSEVDDQRQRVKYQMGRTGDSWQVLYRLIETTFDD